MSDSVSRRHVTVSNANGLHLVPCSLVARLAGEYDCDIRIHKGSLVVDAKTVLELMTLGATQGTQLELEADGPGSEEAVQRLVELFDSGFRVDESEPAT